MQWNSYVLSIFEMLCEAIWSIQGQSGRWWQMSLEKNQEQGWMVHGLSDDKHLKFKQVFSQNIIVDFDKLKSHSFHAKLLRLVCICFAQFANLRNFKIALRKLEIAKLQTNFEIAQPSLCNFEIARPSLHNFEIALRKLEIAKLHSAIF